MPQPKEGWGIVRGQGSREEEPVPLPFFNFAKPWGHSAVSCPGDADPG